MPGYGRPTTLTADLTATFAAKIRKVHFFETAAALCRIHKGKLYRWLNWGEAEWNRLEAGEPLKHNDGTLYVDFYIAVREALAQSEEELADEIRQGVPSWQSRAWLLERRMPDKYAILDRKREAELLERIKELESNATRRGRKKAPKAPKKAEDAGDA